MLNSPSGKTAAVEACRLCKAFGGARALRSVSFSALPGEAHAVMGENGAGKSTLVKILAGLQTPDSGDVLVRGKRLKLRSPHEAMRHGIVMIHQELMPVPDMTVAENLLLGREPRGRFPGTVNRRAMRGEALRLLGLLEADLPVDAPMRSLSVAAMQTVEIARALGSGAAVVIMDEPTAAISEREAEALFRNIGALKSRGGAVIYITHKMDEVFRVADRITVLRDGERVGTGQAVDYTDQSLVAMMVGRELPAVRRRAPAASGECLLRVKALTREGAYHNVSFELRRGEVLGLAGLMGAGRSEVASAIFGLCPADSGEIFVKGKTARVTSPACAMRLGIGMVTEDRRAYGLVPMLPVGQNITLAHLRGCCRGPLINKRVEAEKVAQAFAAYGIKAKNTQQAAERLSGGNQQKAVIARTLLTAPQIVILDEPTRGIDVGAKDDVHAIVTDLAAQGRAILLISSELPELLKLSHRLLVMRQGQAVAELDPRSCTQEKVLSYALPV